MWNCVAGCAVWFDICFSVLVTSFSTFERDYIGILSVKLWYRSINASIWWWSPADIGDIGPIDSHATICAGLVVEFVLCLNGAITAFPGAHATQVILSVWRIFTVLSARYSLVFAIVCNVDIVAWFCAKCQHAICWLWSSFCIRPGMDVCIFGFILRYCRGSCAGWVVYI